MEFKLPSSLQEKLIPYDVVHREEAAQTGWQIDDV